MEIFGFAAFSIAGFLLAMWVGDTTEEDLKVLRKSQEKLVARVNDLEAKIKELQS